MNRSIPPFFILVTALLGFAFSRAAEPDPASITIAVPGGDSLVIRTPAGWKQDGGKPQPEAPPMIGLTTPGGLQINLTMIADPDGRFTTPEAVDDLVTMANQRYVANSIEKTPKLTRLTAKVGHGSYCTFTDSRLVGVATPAAGEYRNVTSGVYVTGKQAVIFTILSNDTKSAEFQSALDLVSNGISVAGTSS